MAQAVIAVLDGDWACKDLLVEVLTAAGYHAVGWTVGTDAAALIQHSRPDLVILDTWLQERDDGWALLQWLWRTPGTATIPVLVCSSDPQALHGRLPLLAERGCAALAKPFALAELRAQLRTLLVRP